MSDAASLELSSRLIDRDVELLATPPYSAVSDAVCRYAYTEPYRLTTRYFSERLEGLGFTVAEDAVGNLVARNRPPGEPAFGIGSHHDSIRRGGRYDGTLGIAIAVEICRLNLERRLGLPLQVVSFVEEEGAGFGTMLLGSRIVAGTLGEADLKERIRSLDDGRSFFDHAQEAGYEPERASQARRMLDGLSAWIEAHIEQGRVLQDSRSRIGVVDAIAGFEQGMLSFRGRADHAGATPMGFRRDAGVAAAEVIVEVERLAMAAGRPTVATVGAVEFRPGILNVVPAEADLTLDVRGVEDADFCRVAASVIKFARATAARRELAAQYELHQNVPVTHLDERVVLALEGVARAGAIRYRRMPSGAAHDTMSIAQMVPSAMVFVPCRDGVSHSPDEAADVRDAALAAELILTTIQSLAQANLA